MVAPPCSCTYPSRNHQETSTLRHSFLFRSQPQHCCNLFLPKKANRSNRNHLQRCYASWTALSTRAGKRALYLCNSLPRSFVQPLVVGIIPIQLFFCVSGRHQRLELTFSLIAERPFVVRISTVSAVVFAFCVVTFNCHQYSPFNTRSNNTTARHRACNLRPGCIYPSEYHTYQPSDR